MLFAVTRHYMLPPFSPAPGAGADAQFIDAAMRVFAFYMRAKHAMILKRRASARLCHARGDERQRAFCCVLLPATPYTAAMPPWKRRHNIFASLSTR
jgi:hypothetical protein